MMKSPLVSLALLLSLATWVDAAEQRIDLAVGWNAVHLEVSPEATSADALFGNLPIEQVALWIPSKAKVESLTDPTALPSKPSDWLIWHPADHPAAFLNTLTRVQGRRTMLVKARQAAILRVTGTSLYERQSWSAPSFNLVGFDVNPAAPPTFARFFAGSRAHEDLLVYRLADNAWKRVSGKDQIKRGEAYWVWCKEGSDFQGPLDLTVRVAETLRVEATVNGQLPIHLASNIAQISGEVLTPGRRQTWAVGNPSEVTRLSISGGGMLLDFPFTSTGN